MIDVYVDGSYSPDVGGIGIVVSEDGKIVRKIGKAYVGTTHNRMEAIACINAMALCNKMYPDQEVVIYTDNTLVARMWQDVQKKIIYPGQHIDIQIAMFRLMTDNFTLKYIKRNSCHAMEEADSIAKQYRRGNFERSKDMNGGSPLFTKQYLYSKVGKPLAKRIIEYCLRYNFRV